MRVKTNNKISKNSIVSILDAEKIKYEVISDIELSVADTKDIRLLLQQKLDRRKFDFENNIVLINGSTLWSYKKVITDLSKKKVTSSYLHNFLVSHMDMSGKSLPKTNEDLCALIKNINPPTWKTDVKRIIRKIKKT